MTDENKRITHSTVPDGGIPRVRPPTISKRGVSSPRESTVLAGNREEYKNVKWTLGKGLGPAGATGGRQTLVRNPEEGWTEGRFGGQLKVGERSRSVENVQAEISLQQGETPGVDCEAAIAHEPQRGAARSGQGSPARPGGQRLQQGPFGPSFLFAKVIIFRTFYSISN